MQFTDKYIANLKPTGKRYFVREQRGFAIRVQPSGLRTFFYIYTFEGERKHFNLGDYPEVSLAEARKEYLKNYLIVSRGLDPKAAPVVEKQDEEKEEDLTFGHFAELFLAWSEKNHVPSWYKTNKLSLNNDVLPYWKDKKITDIRRRDAIELLERVAKRAPGQSANVQKAARSVFDYAIQREYRDDNPMLRLSKVIPALKVTTRERTLTDAEIKYLWTAIDAGPGDDFTKRALKLILVTAQRPGEVSGMHRDELDGCWWTIPKERAEKGKGDHLVYLTPTALQLIGDREGFIFPSPKDGQPLGRNSLAQLVSSEMTKKGEVTKQPYYGLPRWTPHDLRRTARTCMARIGIIDEHAEAVIAHCKQGIKKVYNKHEYQEEKKQALIKWEAELLRITSEVQDVH